MSQGPLSGSLLRSCALLDVKRAIRSISHALFLSISRDQLCHSLLLLLARIVADAARFLLSSPYLDVLLKGGVVCSRKQYQNLVCYPTCFGYHKRRQLSRLFSAYRGAEVGSRPQQLVRSVLYPVTERNQSFVSDICAFWLNVIRTSIKSDALEVG